MPITIELTHEQCIEVRNALEAEITRTKDALSLPFVREMHALRERADNTISVLSTVLKNPGLAVMTERRE